ncbi:MAG: PEGA domain-containing protein [Draconibacterium sp.]|nr:PEGA domain-containing protein [Draconibacterium sp.]
MKRMISKAGIILLALLLTNCAAIIHGNKQIVDFSSQPSGAIVYIDGKEYGTTPTSVELKRMGRLKGESSEKKEYQVKIHLDGYHPYEIKVKRTVDGWFFGNIIFGGLIGIIIDAATGSMYKLTPDQVIATIGKESAAIQQIDENIFIAVTLDINPKWEKVGQLAKK